MTIKDIVFVYQLRTPELVRWHSRRHQHGRDEFELHYFLGGDGHFRNGSERYVITPGTLHVTNPGVPHAIRPDDAQRPVSYYAVLFSPDNTDQIRDLLADRAYATSFPRRVGSRYRVLFEDLKNRYAHTRLEKRAAATHRLQALLWDLAADAPTDPPGPDTGIHGESARRGSSPNPGSGPHNDGNFNVHITRAISMFEHNIRSRITVAAVARRLEISQAHLTRLFTHHFGVPPLQYYRRLRMDVAASLLLNTTRSIKEISWELGYANPFHFSRSFSRYADISPQEYRRQYFQHNPTEYASKIVDG